MYRRKKQCRICNKEHQSRLKGFLSYPKHLLFGKLPNYFKRLTQKLNEKQIQIVNISDNHICYIIDYDICDGCWQFMYQGFQCRKCNTFNYNYKQEKKQCCLCNALYCQKCDRRVELFSQSGLCSICQMRHIENIKSIKYLFSIFVIWMFPCFAFKHLFTKLIETFDKFQYTNFQKMMCFSSFILIFPLVYSICVIGLTIILIQRLFNKLATLI
ncbi:unnamed protein product [Paramecium sonneborni]|uniref:Uncharacterized protein n=1 Tax=Paramecium sonneborni TaxID=65129 RepID=A0A8S1RH97_9CILI|nr:unnamed protein product [Paramecium sonneborni]